MDDDKLSVKFILRDCDIANTIAAPSWVIFGDIVDNCMFLKGRVDEVALLFFETESCLKYTKKDLPESLSEIGLAYHIHHPLDLPWGEGGRVAADIVYKLSQIASHLNIKSHVVHPPKFSANSSLLIKEFLNELSALGIERGKVFFENIEENSLIEDYDTVIKNGAKVCLDLGHYLYYEQFELFKKKDFFNNVGMVHLSCPGNNASHRSLLELDEKGELALSEILSNIKSSCVINIELFKKNIYFESIYKLKEYYTL